VEKKRRGRKDPSASSSSTVIHRHGPIVSPPPFEKPRDPSSLLFGRKNEGDAKLPRGPWNILPVRSAVVVTIFFARLDGSQLSKSHRNVLFFSID
jgi:hypothetical protein